MDRNDEQMITALRDGLHGLHLARMSLVGEARELRIAGRKAEWDAVWSRVEEITAQIETTNRELAEHMLFPCPFCGGVAKHTYVIDEHWCFCTACGAAGRMRGTRQQAVDAWNTRTAK